MRPNRYAAPSATRPRRSSASRLPFIAVTAAAGAMLAAAMPGLTGCAGHRLHARMVSDLLNVQTAAPGRAPIAPLTATYGDFSMDEAYRLQDDLVAKTLARGGRVTGYKVAYASKASQEKWGIREPVYGRFTTGMQAPDGGAIDKSRFLMFHIEAEVVFAIDRRIDGPIAAAADLIPYVRSVHAGLEVPDNHFADGPAKKRAADVVADNCGATLFVIGPGRPPAGLDVDSLTATLLVNGRPHSSAPATAVLGSPWNSLFWLHQALRRRGIALEAGDIVFTGTLGDSYVGPGEKAVGEYVGDLGVLGQAKCVVR